MRMRRFLSALFTLPACAALHAQLTTVTMASPSVTVPPNFLGLSMEWCSAQTVLGQAGTPVSPLCGPTTGGTDAIFRNLMGNLNAYGAGPVLIRVGGNTTDIYTGIQNVQPVVEAASGGGMQFTLGVSLRSATVAQTATQAAAYAAQMPPGSLLAVEVGNEPDGYPGITGPGYFSSLQAAIGAIQAAAGTTVKMMYPSCSNGCGAPMNVPYAAMMVLGSNTGSMGIASQHEYPFDRTSCPASSTTPGGPNYDCLLKKSSLPLPPTMGDYLNFFQQPAEDAAAFGVPYRVDELGSVSGGGMNGVSNAHEAGLWAVAMTFGLASQGVAGVNFHCNCYAGAGTWYDPFWITYTQGTPNAYSLAPTGAIGPVYYGMLLFAEATPVVAGRPAEIAIPTIAAGTSANIAAWQTVDGANNDRLVLLNLDESASGNVSVAAPSCTSATASYLTAASWTSTTGITINGNGAVGNGQTFDGSTDGRIAGTASPATLTPSGGVFSIPMSTTQAALVQFTPAGCVANWQ